MSSTSLNHKWGSCAVDLSGQQSMLAIASPGLNLPSQVVHVSELGNLATLSVASTGACQQQSWPKATCPFQVRLGVIQLLKLRCNQSGAVEHASQSSLLKATSCRLAPALGLLPPCALLIQMCVRRYFIDVWLFRMFAWEVCTLEDQLHTSVVKAENLVLSQYICSYIGYFDDTLSLKKGKLFLF